MGTKITVWVRDEITKDLLRHRYAKPCDRMVRDLAAFAGKVYNDIYSTAVRKKMAELPEGWLPTRADIAIKFGEASHGYDHLSLNGTSGGRIGQTISEPVDTVERRFLTKHERGCIAVYDDAHPLTIAYLALRERRAALIAEIEAAECQSRAAIGGASTIGKLIDSWPEVEPFAAKYDVLRPQLPAMPTAQLNEMLGLPAAA